MTYTDGQIEWIKQWLGKAMDIAAGAIADDEARRALDALATDGYAVVKKQYLSDIHDKLVYGDTEAARMMLIAAAQEQDR